MANRQKEFTPQSGYHQFRKGLFTPSHPEKYDGDPTKIVWRSSWEFKYMMQLDHDPNVISWQSEEFAIPYISPIDRRRHRYFPDFKVIRKQPNGKPKTFVIEIKPAAQTKLPKHGKKNDKKFMTEAFTYAKNIAKWESATKYCESRGWTFQILTEFELKVF